MMRNLAGFIAFFLVCCHADAAPAEFKDSAGRVFLIMPESSLQQALRLFQKEKCSYWKPTSAETKNTAELIHAALVHGKKDPAFVADLARYPAGDWRFEYVARKIEDVLSHYPSYACQVIGLEETGKKFIAFSFFETETNHPRKNLESHFVQVLDGGAGYWRIEFDVAEKRFVRFEENGDG